VVREYSSAAFVFISSRTGPTMGRVERRMLRVMAELVARGSTVHLICAPHHPIGDEAAALGVEVASYRLDRFNYFRTRSRVRKYLERYHPIVVHSTGLDADLIARWAARGLRTAAVNSLTCVAWPRRGRGPVSTAIRRYLDATTIDRTDLFVVDCTALVNRLVGASVPRECVVVDAPSIDIAEVLREAEEPAQMPERPIGPLVGYGGRMELSRGLEHLVAASAILDARGTIAEVIVAGEGPLLKELKGDTRSSRVRYLGYVESVPAVLKRLSVAVFPSVGPGVPTALLEAAALGRPIIASRVEGIEDLFEDGSEIRLVPPGDPRALAVAISDVLADPVAARAMGERARVRTIDEYSSAASVERHLEVYSRFMRG
jgi:glycosyltransferase involved in cell wall biosynthesis